MIRFRCPTCTAAMRAKESEAGEKRKCPSCQSVFRIPQPGKAKQKSKSESLVPVVCGVCSTRIYAKLSQVGQSIECPDCFTQNLVKKPEASKISSGPNIESLGDYGLAPAEDVQVVKTLNENLLEEAEEQVEREIEEGPQLPDKPFVSGIFFYPFRGDVLPVLIGMAMSWTFCLLLLNWAWELEGFASAIAPFILAVIAIITAMVVLPSLVTFQNIMEHGANGDEETEVRPDGGLFAMYDWVVEVVPIVIAATVSSLPTLGLYHLSVYLLPDVVPWNPFVEVAISFAAYMLFPLVMLSILENNSILGLYSRQIWGSVSRQFGSWMKFGLLASVLSIVFLGLSFGFQRLWAEKVSMEVALGTLGCMCVLLCGLSIYFRIVGRLAFVLTVQDTAVRSAPRDPSTADEDLEFAGA